MCIGHSPDVFPQGFIQTQICLALTSLLLRLSSDQVWTVYDSPEAETVMMQHRMGISWKLIHGDDGIAEIKGNENVEGVLWLWLGTFLTCDL